MGREERAPRGEYPREVTRSRMAEAAITNEYVTRHRVAMLEKRLGDLEARSFWGRLRWLFTGR